MSCDLSQRFSDRISDGRYYARCCKRQARLAEERKKKQEEEAKLKEAEIDDIDITGSAQRFVHFRSIFCSLEPEKIQNPPPDICIFNRSACIPAERKLL